MLGNNVFLFPDYGDGFLRSAKANALYAKQIFSSALVLTAESEARVSSFILIVKDRLQSESEESQESLRPALTYFEFVLRAQPIIRPLVDAGVFHGPDLNRTASALVGLTKSDVGRKDWNSAFDMTHLGFSINSRRPTPH